MQCMTTTHVQHEEAGDADVGRLDGVMERDASTPTVRLVDVSFGSH